jgi:hypothetical protein
MEERIICAAIWFDDGRDYVHQPKNISSGFVIAGMRHHNCFNTVSILTADIEHHTQYEKEQGFITTHNRFVDREEGAKIAYDAGQIKIELKKLFSEDLY